MAEPSPGEIIGRNIRNVRESKLFSRPDLAKLSGVSLAGIDHLERGLSARPRRRTIEKLAKALGVDVEMLMEGTDRPLGEAPPSQEKLFNNGVLEEERRADWRATVDNARRLREGGRARMEELLTAWQASRQRGELRSARQGYLAEMGELLDKAYRAQAPLVNMFFAGLMQRAAGEWEADWEEILAAERFYWTLIEMMRDAGFVITESRSEPPEVEEPDAA